ncbi:MAG TPA: gamma-glutamylcyclotransferase family protein, partial [Beijerinckiaceae bacterium]|nr:gamma-glutamylcyclotransferase family protein [Beijerinckiaceae bacterium]
MPLVFAYGSNMDRGAMARRCPKSTALGRARLLRHRFVILPQGYASIAPDIRAAVYGVVWDVKFADMLSL